MPDDRRKAEGTPQDDEVALPSTTMGPGPALGFVAGPRFTTLDLEAETAADVLPAAESASGALGPLATALGTAGAALAAVGGIALAGESLRAAAAGEKTPIDVADDYYQTHFGDIWGWIKGDYDKRNVAKEKQHQLQQATRDSSQVFSNTPADSPTEQCQSMASPAAAAAATPTPEGSQLELLTEEQLRQVEYKSYKARCNQSPPPGLNPCDLARWKLQRNKDCRNLRQAWDDKWLPGRHQKDIQNLDQGIKNLEDWIRRNCK
jgi:hypothetical protein